MSKHAVLLMMKNRYGRIVNMSSVGGEIGLPGQANYAASKAGQVAISQTLSKEVAKRGITVNNVLPGFIDTELIADLPEEQRKEYMKDVPMRRFGKVEEVAHAVLFFASKEASYITGASVAVDGGL
jgi:3-oxoacyl-[acyl-carrier protein] reductase